MNYECVLDEKEIHIGDVAITVGDITFIFVILLFGVGWAKHVVVLYKNRIKYYSKQVSVAHFTLTATINPDLWVFFELLA